MLEDEDRSIDPFRFCPQTTSDVDNEEEGTWEFILFLPIPVDNGSQKQKRSSTRICTVMNHSSRAAIAHFRMI